MLSNRVNTNLNETTSQTFQNSQSPDMLEGLRGSIIVPKHNVNENKVRALSGSKRRNTCIALFPSLGIG